jgi:uncharacterized protein YggE
MRTFYLFICILIMSTNMQAQTEAFPSRVDVSGTGTVKITPDQVLIGLRVENTGNDAATVKRENDQVVAAVLRFLKDAGVPDSDVQTEYIRLNKNYNYNSKTYNYVANQSINVLLKDLSKYESVMNGLISSGMNRIDNINFGSSERERLEVEARKKAVLNAKQKAGEYAAALGQQIGSAVRISEQTASVSPGVNLRSFAVADAAESEATIAPGELEIRVNVQVSFILLGND